jgi:hypothetical protein
MINYYNCDMPFFLEGKSFSFIQDLSPSFLERIHIIMGDTVEKEKNHAGFIAVHVGRFRRDYVDFGFLFP